MFIIIDVTILPVILIIMSHSIFNLLGKALGVGFPFFCGNCRCNGLNNFIHILHHELDGSRRTGTVLIIFNICEQGIGFSQDLFQGIQFLYISTQSKTVTIVSRIRKLITGTQLFPC